MLAFDVTQSPSNTINHLYHTQYAEGNSMLGVHAVGNYEVYMSLTLLEYTPNKYSVYGIDKNTGTPVWGLSTFEYY